MSYGGITGQTPEKLEQELKAHVDNKNNPHRVTKEQLGLSNVETWELIGEQSNVEFSRAASLSQVVIFEKSLNEYTQLKLIVGVEAAYLKNSGPRLTQGNIALISFNDEGYTSSLTAIIHYGMRTTSIDYTGLSDISFSVTPEYGNINGPTNTRKLKIPFSLENTIDWSSGDYIRVNVKLYGLK